MAPLPLIFLFAVHSESLQQFKERLYAEFNAQADASFITMNSVFAVVSSADWVVNYNPLHICALKDSSVIMSCTFKYPTGHQIRKVFWNKDLAKHGEELADLSEDPEYSQRLQYLGDKQQNCTIRLSHVTKKDERMYYFRIITDRTDGKWTGKPGVRLNVTDPPRNVSVSISGSGVIMEGDSVSLSCSTDSNPPAEINWLKGTKHVKHGRNFRISKISSDDSGEYKCSAFSESGDKYSDPILQRASQCPSVDLL
nr:B-cell receptor CD22-like [Danio rerio]|eukprot:XP_021333849.1 B-cell receptor CD22-like [Danio rerio]